MGVYWWTTVSQKRKCGRKRAGKWADFMSFYVSHLCPTIEISHKQDQKCLRISGFLTFSFQLYLGQMCKKFQLDWMMLTMKNMMLRTWRRSVCFSSGFSDFTPRMTKNPIKAKLLIASEFFFDHCNVEVTKSICGHSYKSPCSRFWNIYTIQNVTFPGASPSSRSRSRHAISFAFPG